MKNQFFLTLVITLFLGIKPGLAWPLPMIFPASDTNIDGITLPIPFGKIEKKSLIRIGTDSQITFKTIGMGTKLNSKKIIAQGAPLHGTNGLMFGSDNYLYIASVVGREIVVMNPKTGKILRRLGIDQGVEGPDDLVFGPDGSLYWTSYLTGEVGRLSPDGQKSTVAQLVPGVNGITFSDDGRLFVSLVSLADALYELDPEGKDPPRLISANLGGFDGIAFGPDGFLYGALCFRNQVARIDVDTGSITTVADGFDVPSAVKFDSHGHLYVTDSRNGEVVCVDVNSGNKKVIARLTPVLDNLAFNQNDQLFVSNTSEGSIDEVLPDGTTRTLSKGGMILPGGVAVLPRPHGGESVFVADLWSLRTFNGSTGRQEDIERHVIGFSAMAAPLTVSPDGSNLILSSFESNAVQVWNPDTHQVVENYSDVAMPINAIRFQGELVAAELMTGSVIRLSDGTPLASGLTIPAGLAATKDTLWVGDWATGVVWQVASNGQPISVPIPVATGLSNPEGLAVETQESLLVIEAGAARLSRIDLVSGKVSPVAENLKLGAQAVPGTPPTWAFNGVAVSPSGTIYVTSDIDNVLYQIKTHSLFRLHTLNGL